MCRDELKSLDEAVDYYDCALDSFFAQPERLDEPQLPRALKSFEAIDTVLTTKRDWKAQERAYRDMIKRLPKRRRTRVFHKLQVGLIDGLGEIYRSRLKQYDDGDRRVRDRAADGSEERARAMAPTAPRSSPSSTWSPVRTAPTRRSSSTRACCAANRSSTTRTRRSRSIYADTQPVGQALVPVQHARVSKKADADERAFYEQYRPRGLVKAKHAMSRGQLGQARAPRREPLHLGDLRRVLAGRRRAQGVPTKDFGVKREERRQLKGDQLTFSGCSCTSGHA